MSRRQVKELARRLRKMPKYKKTYIWRRRLGCRKP
jgi:hypothetical protein